MNLNNKPSNTTMSNNKSDAVIQYNRDWEKMKHPII